MAPNRRGKKGTLQYALEVCDRGQLLTIISSKGDLDGKAGLEVMNCIRKAREVFRDPISPLQGAVSLGHYNISKHLVEEGASLRSSSNVPHPLCLALQKAHYDIAHLLIHAGADVNLPFEDSYPMSYALDASKCTVQIVKDLIAAGCPINGIVHRPSQRTVLHTAVKMGHLSIVKYLFSLSVDPNVRDIRGLTPMHYAVQKNSPAMVKFLFKKGAILDCECVEHFTPMFYAIAIGNYDMVKLLLSLGADIHYINGSKKCSMTPLHFAANFCQFKIAQYLLDKGADVNRAVEMTGEIALHSAARANCQDIQQNKIALDCIVELLVKQGSNLSSRHKYGLTPLQVAVKAKNLSVAKILIINGSELNDSIHDVDKKIYTTFHIAAKCFDRELVKLCLDYGADCNVKDEEGLYPIHLALLTAMLDFITHTYECRPHDYPTFFKLFWKHGFPFDMTLNMRWLVSESPPFPPQVTSLVHKQKMLFAGVKLQQLKLVQKAISQGAEVKSCSTDIPSPIHYIVSKGNDTILKLFLMKGVPVNYLDKRGETALHTAAKAGHLKCCQLLLEYGAIYNYTSEKCPKTPLKMASDNGHSEVVTLLITVNKYFQGLKKGHLKKLKLDTNILSSVMNCSHQDGMTLLGRAIDLDSKKAVERLMKLRIHMHSTSN